MLDIAVLYSQSTEKKEIRKPVIGSQYSPGSVSVHLAIPLCLLKGIKVTDRLLLPPGGKLLPSE